MRGSQTVIVLVGWAIFAGPVACGSEPTSQLAGGPRAVIRALTTGPNHHFFGYYGISPWNRSGRRLVCLETGFQDRMPRPDDPAVVGLVDANTGGFTGITETHAWNFQQGAMLHWNPRSPEHGLLFNDRKDGRIVSVSLDVRSPQERRYFPRAISAVSHDGRYALSLTYGRLRRLRPVVGYVGATDPNPRSAAPKDDGVFLMDLTTGEARLIVSVNMVYELLAKAHPELRGRHMWFNHTVFNTDDTRFLFLARANLGLRGGRRSAMFTANLDGTDLREAVPYGRRVSHFDWRSPTEIVATFQLDGRETKHVLLTDGRDDYRQVGRGFLVGDGHCTFGPDRDWLATDPRVDQPTIRGLQIYNVRTQAGFLLGRFPLGKYFAGDLRCDLHPRWKRTGDAICFDALETEGWTRQLHVAELHFPD